MTLPLNKSATPRKPTRSVPTHQLGDLMRYWREMRGKNQLELSLDSGVSQKQISFLENGRSTPARETLVCISEALDVPLRERNQLFLAAGYAPIYAEKPWNEVEMKSITAAIARILRHHEPFPALVMDRHWNVVMVNEAAPKFFGKFVDMSARREPRNMLHLVFDPDGLRPFIADWETSAKSLLQRVYREATRGFRDQKTDDLIDALLAYPGVRAEWKRAKVFETDIMSVEHPVIPLGFHKDGKILRYFSMVTTVGAPQSVAAQELRIETMFPFDGATEELHGDLMSAD